MKNKILRIVSSIKNGQLANKPVVKQKSQKNCETLLNILWDEGYILGYKIIPQSNTILVYLKYNDDKSPAITNFKIVSKSSLKVYYSVKQLWKLNISQTLVILSTNKGLLSLNSCKKLGIGGEPVLIII